MDDKIKAILREVFPVPPHLQQLAYKATLDLLFGPIADNDPDDPDDVPYLGYCDALNQIQSFCNDLPSELWIDTFNGTVHLSEPEQWESDEGEIIEPDWNDYIYIDRRSDIIRSLFSSEIASHL